ncbi:hypothetical protein PODOV006v2_p0024 [Vibrio phage 15E36.1]|uniref:Uncharacterized protein n=1 Tax=Vibrio phage 15E36.1 TaxID=2859290 RepID=A0AAE7XVK6_9CAUD|nr:hypothetical protein PODOV006v2_p0024 [Vibrio phage 15E36.1]
MTPTKVAIIGGRSCGKTALIEAIVKSMGGVPPEKNRKPRTSKGERVRKRQGYRK